MRFNDEDSKTRDDTLAEDFDEHFDRLKNDYA
jgi:hypothetical protein